MHILKKKREAKVTTDIVKEGNEYRVRLFINGHPQCEEDYYTEDLDDATARAQVMREECIAQGAKDELRSTKDAIKIITEADGRPDLHDEEIAIEESNKIYDPILHRFGKWMYEAEEFRIYSEPTKHTKELPKELMEELWGIRYDLELFQASGLYKRPGEEDPSHKSPSMLWEMLDEKTIPEDFRGYEHYKSKRDKE